MVTRLSIVVVWAVWWGSAVWGRTVIIQDVQDSLTPEQEARITRIAEQVAIFHDRHSPLADLIVLPIHAFAKDSAFDAHMIKRRTGLTEPWPGAGCIFLCTRMLAKQRSHVSL